MRDLCACARVFDKRAISHHHRLLVMIYLPIGGERVEEAQFLPRIFNEYRNVAAIFAPIFSNILENCFRTIFYSDK